MSTGAFTEGDLTYCDWRRTNVLNPIKNQKYGTCCFAFAVCGVLEVLHWVEKQEKQGELIELSAQDIFDNFHLDEKQDEDGRSIVDTINWVKQNGCVLEKSCPYMGVINQTKIDRKVCLRFVNSREVDLKDDLKIKKEKRKIYGKILEAKIRNAPVVAQIFWTKELKDWKGDAIYSGPEHADAFKKEEYHAIIIIGYSQEIVKKKLVKFWIVRNSHGETWGENGYGKINRAPCHGKLLIDVAWVLEGILYEDPNGKIYPNAIGN